MSENSARGEAAQQVTHWLCECAGVKPADLEQAARLAASPEQGDILACLVRLGRVPETDVAQGWHQVLGIPLITDDNAPETSGDLPPLSERFLRHHRLLPVNVEGNLWLIMANPADQQAIDAIHHACGQPPQVAVAAAGLIDSLIERNFGQGRSAMGSLIETLDGEGDGPEDIEQLKDLASEAPVIRLVNLIMQRAVEQRASDIHIEPFEQTLKVRYRIDGVLHESEAPPAGASAAVISRIKIMARLDIAERRLPQDGRIMLRVQGKALDLRVSTVPTSFGESVVMRLLDRENVQLDFAHLGFEGERLDRFLALLDAPHGILLVTGPTGSGKTTTLYTALSQLNQSERKIITVEDPVEYQLEGVNQIQVKPAIGLDFPDALRAIMRQDPDVIMIGEMRDLPTCHIAIQSSLTGHLVLSTLHTNSAAESITRLLDMGVENYLLASTVRGVLAQRLVRRLDPATRIAYDAPPALVAQLNLDRYLDQPSEKRPIRLYRPDPAAPGGGYLGRSAISELLVIDETLHGLLLRGADARSLEQAARQHQGFRSLYEEGLRQALAGITSLDEVLRVAGKSA